MALPRIYGPYVPSTIIKKYLVMWLSKDSDRSLELAGAVCGLHPRALYRIMHGESETVRFVTTDQILVRLGYYMAWHEDPDLGEYYAAA